MQARALPGSFAKPPCACMRACARAHVPSHEGWAMELPSWTSPKLPPEIPGRFSHHVTTSLEQPRRFPSSRSEGCQKGSVWSFKVAKSIPKEFKVAGCGVLKWPEKAGDIRWRRRFTPKLARHSHFKASARELQGLWRWLVGAFTSSETVSDGAARIDFRMAQPSVRTPSAARAPAAARPARARAHVRTCTCAHVCG